MEKYREEKNGSVITLWASNGVGIQFKEGDSLQRYTHSIVIRDGYSLSTEEAVKEMNDTANELSEYAATKYPKEFAPLKTSSND